jgi:dipeptidyl aminopeptidase/acylaminoacyl peptidase
MLRYLLGLTLVVFASAAAATSPAPLDVGAYSRLPNTELVQLSPSGERLASVVVNGDQRQIVIRDLAGKVLYTGPMGDTKVRNLAWAGDDHFIVFTSFTRFADLFRDGWEVEQAVVGNLATGRAFVVFANETSILHSTFGYRGAIQKDGHWYGLFGGVTMNKTRGFDATLNSNATVDLYQVDLDSNVAERLASAGGREQNWAVDASGTIVATSDYDEHSGTWKLQPRSGADPLIETSDPIGDIWLAGLGRSLGTVVVNKPEPEEWSLADRNHTPFHFDGQVDGYLHDPTTRRLVGVWIAGDRRRQVFFEPILKARQAAFAKALGGDPQILSWSADFKRMVLYTDTNGDAGTYWLVDGGAVKPIAYAYPEIPDANVGGVRAITYRAADGVEIHGVLTLPPGREPKRLPLVVIPHGGPEDYAAVGFDYWAQAFAGRGYAVFQPNFRGSGGYGVDFRNAGFGQWGRKMQTDISDGVAELSRQGIVDPKRACIVGGSYGGYAALAGVTVQQGLYRCAVAYGGISDLNVFLDWVTPEAYADDRTAVTRYLRRYVGAKSATDPLLHDISPARFADRADAPVLLIHGLDDTVVPISQSELMERELKHAGKPVEFVKLQGEDHWLSKDATRKAMLIAAIQFVEKYDPAN